MGSDERHMNPWPVLDLEPTKDEQAIKQAYLQKLPLFHPEEDQEGFRRLREAYEEALRLLTLEPEPETEDDSPSGLVVRDFKAVYRDFPQRINPDSWQEILNREICQRIDVQQEIGEKLLYFFMQAPNLPHKVWKLLAEFFAWQECQDVLRQKFPGNFIDFVLDKALYDDPLRYELFPTEQGLDYDLFINNFLNILDLMSSGQKEQIETLLLETDLLGIDHLDYSLLKIRHYLLSEQKELAAPLAESLLEAYPEDSAVLHGTAQCRLHTDGPQAALPLFEKVLQKHPDHYNARVGLANCAYYEEDYETAKQAYRELLLEFPYDIYVGNAFYSSNEKLIPVYEGILAADPGNQDARYKLASCYHNCRRFSDARDLLAEVKPEAEFAAKHHNIYAYALMMTEKTEEALIHYNLWEPLEEDRLRVARELPGGLLAVGQVEEALSKCEFYLRDYPQEASLYDVKASALRQKRQLNEALEVIEKGLACNRGHLNLHMTKAEILYAQRNYGAALDSAATALQIFPYVRPMLILQVKIFFDVGDYEQVLSICEQISNYEMEDREGNLYKALANLNLNREVSAAIDYLNHYTQTDPAHEFAVYALKEYYLENNDLGKALSYLNAAIAVNPEHPFFRLDRARIYRRLKSLKAAKEELEWIENSQLLEHPDFYNEKGFLYEELNDNESAMLCYEKAISLNEYDIMAYGNLAGLFSQAGEYEKAAEYYTKQIAIREHPHYYISRGLAYCNLGRSEDEKADYLKTIELDPNYAYAYNNLGIVYYEEANYSDAADYLEQALAQEMTILSAHQYLAKTYIAAGETEKALESLNKSIVYFQELAHESALQLLSGEKLDLLCDWGRYEEALLLKDFHALPETVQVYLNLGNCAFELHRDQLALEFFEKALNLDDSAAEVYRDLSHFYYHALKKPRKAIKFCEKALAIDPDDYQNHLRLARLYEQEENRKKAAAHYNKALELLLNNLNMKDNKSPCELCSIGDCYRGLGQNVRAIDCYNEALEAAKNYAECVTRNCYKSLFGLALLHEALGDSEQARQLYDQTIAHMPDREYAEKREEFLAKQAGTFKKTGWFSFLKKWI